MLVVIIFYLYLENIIEFLAEQFIKTIVFFLLISFSLNWNTMTVTIYQKLDTYFQWSSLARSIIESQDIHN